jgi:hypothetical protein
VAQYPLPSRPGFCPGYPGACAAATPLKLDGAPGWKRRRAELVSGFQFTCVLPVLQHQHTFRLH